MSNEPKKDNNQLTVDIDAWINRARQDPATLLERQATDVFLTALSMTKPYATQFILKGGVLMGVVYDSPRQTGDIDFTAMMAPTQGIAEQLAKDLKGSFSRASAELGYVDLLCAVQSHKYQPKGDNFPKFDGPAIKLKIGYAKRGSRQEKLFLQSRSSQVLEVDISFKEPVSDIQYIQLSQGGGVVPAYSMTELLAEKYRALLQQKIRNRNRRQDVYDINMLVTGFSLSQNEKSAVLRAFRTKCEARSIYPDENALSDPEIARRARSDWHTLGLEIDELPDFEECFDAVESFYRALPW